MLCPVVWGTSPDLERRGFEKAVLSGAPSGDKGSTPAEGRGGSREGETGT